MKFSLATALSVGLLATTAMATPRGRADRNLAARRAARAEKRASGSRHTNPPFKPNTTEPLKLDGVKNVDYSSNWAGAVLVGTGYYYVTGEFTVPTPSIPSTSSSSGGGGGGGHGGGHKRQGSTEYCGSAWVGIDGDTCDTAILQTGVDWCVTSSGEYEYDAWYEWYPDYAYDFDDITISAGDVVKVTVDATSKTSGTATVDDITTGTSVTYTFSDVSDGSLCEYNAEWIVEDFEEDDELVDFADFGTVTFTDAYALDASGTVTPADATIIDIEQDNEVLTSVTVSGETVTITYV